MWRIGSCALHASGARWNYADRNAAEIDANWQIATKRNPNYFNGVVLLIDSLAMDGEALTASLLRTDFKSCLYWRERGFPAAGVIDGFGSGLIISADGAIILGRQRGGNINSGLSYLPGGFIDDRDVAQDGSIDIVASVAREIEEETGLGARDLERRGGFHVVRAGAQLSIAVPHHSHLPAAELVNRIERHIAASSNSELEEAIAISKLSDLEGLSVPHFTRPLLEALLAGT